MTSRTIDHSVTNEICLCPRFFPACLFHSVILPLCFHSASTLLACLACLPACPRSSFLTNIAWERANIFKGKGGARSRCIGGAREQERREQTVRGVGWEEVFSHPPSSTVERDDGSACILCSPLSYGPYESSEGGASQTGHT